jgi:hypothetical protein
MILNEDKKINNKFKILFDKYFKYLFFIFITKLLGIFFNKKNNSIKLNEIIFLFLKKELRKAY